MEGRKASTHFYLISKVIENEDNRVRPHPDHRAQFLSSHLEATIANHQDGSSVRMSKLTSKSSRKTLSN